MHEWCFTFVCASRIIHVNETFQAASLMLNNYFQCFCVFSVLIWFFSISLWEVSVEWYKITLATNQKATGSNPVGCTMNRWQASRCWRLFFSPPFRRRFSFYCWFSSSSLIIKSREGFLCFEKFFSGFFVMWLEPKIGSFIFWTHFVT